MLQLASFLNDWWFSISKFFHEMNQVVRFLLVGILIICGFMALIKTINKKDKFRVGFIILSIILVGLGILIATI